MSEDEETEIGATPFFSWVEVPPRLPGGDLRTMSGHSMDTSHDPDPTSLMEEVAEAWRTPVERLSCEQVRVLVEQGLGLEWLGEALAEFVRTQPAAFVSFYPGDLTMAALRVFPQLAAHSPVSAARMLDADFSWMDGSYEFSPTLGREAEALLRSAQAVSQPSGKGRRPR